MASKHSIIEIVAQMSGTSVPLCLDCSEKQWKKTRPAFWHSRVREGK